MVAQHFTYGVEPDGRQWTQVNTGGSSAARWQKSWRDWLGRELRLERPAFVNQPNYVETKSYQAGTGFLTTSTSVDMASTLFAYDALSRMIRSGLDLNGNGTLDLTGTDRITESDQYLEFFNGAWWSHTESRQYVSSSSGTPTVMSVQRQRLTGFPAGRLSETQTTDVNTNVTTVTTDVNRATATTTITTATTGVSLAAVETKIAGLTITLKGHDGLTTTVGYDALRRKTTQKDARNNTTTTAYISGTPLILSTTDPTSTIVAIYSYDTMGRPVSQAGAPDAAVAGSPRHYTYSAYNLRGQLVRQWGDAAIPVSYGYDATFGDRTTMSTYRGGSGWEGSTWPANPGTADTTTWAYDAGSGLLARKTDAAGRAVAYTYNTRGQLGSRTWARGITTSYTYDQYTAEQRDILYSDGTPELHYTYNRLGQATRIEDATGTHLLSHCICGKLVSERFDVNFYGNRLLTYALNQGPTGPLGRTLGYTLAGGTGVTEQQLTYAYDGTDRFSVLNTSTPGVASATHAFTYTYLANSGVIEELKADNGSLFKVTRTFELARDVLTAINSQWAGASRTRYDYVTDALGQRSSVKQSGTAFADYYDATHTSTFQAFAYNPRGELTAAPSYLGAAATAGQDLPGRHFEYAYDPVGNRAWSNRTGATPDREAYTANSLNQYVVRDNRTVSLSGTADATANVVVSGRASPVAALRRGRYWSDEFSVPNASSPWRGPLTLYTGKAGAGPAGADLVRLDTRVAQIPANPQSFTYDLDGNLTSDGVWLYTWDAENRLVQMVATSQAVAAGYAARTLRFRYDYLGRRVQKHVIDTPSSQLLSGRRYLYDGWNLIAEFADTGATAIGALVRSYAWGVDIARTLSDAGGVGALLQIADHASGKTYYPCYDGNGNIAALLNSGTGAVAATYEYSPYGEPLRHDVADATVADQPFRFSTKFTDSESGFVYYGRRYYQPANGRFLGRDPIEEQGGLNLYGFCHNNSINTYDILGQVTPEEARQALASSPDNANLFLGQGGILNSWHPGTALDEVTDADQFDLVLTRSQLEALAAKSGNGNYFPDGTPMDAAPNNAGTYGGPGMTEGGVTVLDPFTVTASRPRTSNAGRFMAGTLLLAGAMVADDATVIGIADDPLIPVVLIGGGLIAGGIMVKDYLLPNRVDAKQSGKERASDIPSWAKGQKPLPGENGRDFAGRLLDEKYGPGNYPTGPGSEHSKIKKFGDRGGG